MTDFSLDLRSVEDEIEDDEEGAFGGEVVLGVLDGTTDDERWTETVLAGNALVLAVEGEINELAAGFARAVRDEGGELVHFRGFLIVTPPGVSVNTDRL